MYLALLLLTLLFGTVAYNLYAADLYERLEPQIERAMVQVSKILPQLEETEKAVRAICDDLEENRQYFHSGSEEELKNSATENNISADTVINNTLSWMNRITNIRLGREGHVIVISKEDYTILAHPDKDFVGQKLVMANSRTFDRDSVPDLDEADGELTEEDIPDGFRIFFPTSIFSLNVNKVLDALSAGVAGSVFSYKDTYILCGVTLWEGFTHVVVRCFISTLIFFAIAWVIIRYVGFAINWRKASKEEFRRKLISYFAIGTITLFLSTWYYQTIMDVTGDLAAVNGYAEAAVDTLKSYEDYGKELSKWLDRQYLEECGLAADIIKKKGKDNITRKDLEEYAKALDVEYIYIFDKNGKVIVTNSPYDHFSLSQNPEDQSYAFNTLLDGREYLIQDVMKDDASGEKMQYIGVSLRDSNDLADGFVQIVIKPELREKLLAPINLQTVLYNTTIGLPDYALAIDKESMKIAATNGLGFENTGIEELGFDVEDIQNGYNVESIIWGDSYYSGVGESDNLYLMPLILATDSTNAFIISLIMALLCALSYLILFTASLYVYGKAQNMSEPEEKADEKAASGDKKDNLKESIAGLFDGFVKQGDKSYEDFEKRWKKQSSIPEEERTPEMRISIIIYRLLFVFSLAFLLFEMFLISVGVRDEDLTGFSYVIMGNWERGVNIFSLSYCLFLLCLLYVIQELINQVLYRIARISDLGKETIFLMLRNALKYTCAIVFLYIGLAKLGIDTKALWASAGVLSLMVGFGAKDLVSDIIAGLFIIFEGTLKIGDNVTIGSWKGTVQEIGIRSTRVGQFSETKIFNNSSLKDIVNTNGDLAKETLNIPIPYEADLLEVERLFENELSQMTDRIPGLVKEPKYQGISSFEESCVMLQFEIIATRDDKSKAVRSFRRELKLLFDRENLNMPYNHVVVKNNDLEDGTCKYTPKKEEGDK